MDWKVFRLLEHSLPTCRQRQFFYKNPFFIDPPPLLGISQAFLPEILSSAALQIDPIMKIGFHLWVTVRRSVRLLSRLSVGPCNYARPTIRALLRTLLVRCRATRQSLLFHGKNAFTYLFDVNVVCTTATSEYVDMAKPSRQFANLLTQLYRVALIKSTKFAQLAVALG
jgi:hypothetical protein